MNQRSGDETDDHCTRCHRLTNHTIAAMVGEEIASVTCRTCGFQHPYKGGRMPTRVARTQASAFDQVLAGILGGGAPEAPAAPKRKRKKS